MLLPFFQSFLLLPHHSILFHQFQAFTSIVVVSLLKLNHQMQLLAHGQECLLFEGRSVLTGGWWWEGLVLTGGWWWVGVLVLTGGWWWEGLVYGVVMVYVDVLMWVVEWMLVVWVFKDRLLTNLTILSIKHSSRLNNADYYQSTHINYHHLSIIYHLTYQTIYYYHYLLSASITASMSR